MTIENAFGEQIEKTEDPDSPFYVPPEERVDDDSIDPDGVSNALDEKTGDDMDGWKPGDPV